MATLTYVYRDSTAVVGPLACAVEPHSYDLCADHAGRLTAPRGWEVVRADGELVAPPLIDELTVLAEAVREGTVREGTVRGTPAPAAPARHGPEAGSGRRGHLRVLPRQDAD